MPHHQVHHVVLLGNIPAERKSYFGVGAAATGFETCRLHVFITGLVEEASTRLRGYFFCESPEQINPYGHATQSQNVREWKFPVRFKDLASGASIAAVSDVEAMWRRMGDVVYKARSYPVPFTANFNAPVTHFEASLPPQATLGSSRKSIIGITGVCERLDAQARGHVARQAFAARLFL